MSIVNNQSSQASYDNFLEVSDLQENKIHDDCLSERDILLGEGIKPKPVEITAKKAYFWLKAKSGDKALGTDEANRDRECTINGLEKNGFEVTLFSTNRAFFDHIKKNPSKIDLLIISGHGSPTALEDLRVRDGQIISIDPSLSDQEQREGISRLEPILKEKSIVILHSCLTGNKTVEKNFARLLSKDLPQAKVFASQYIANYEPWLIYNMDEKKQVIVESMMYGGYDESGQLTARDPIVYTKGEETTIIVNGQETKLQEVVSYSPRQRRFNFYPIVAQSLAFLALLGSFAFSGYDITNITESIRSSVF